LTVTPTDLERAVLRSIVDWALDIARDKGAPVFTAAILKDGAEFLRAENRVEETNDPTRHAEVEAISRAGTQLGRSDLSDCTLIASCQPCEMCLAAMRWAKIPRVIFAATQDRIGDDYFRFPGLGIADFRDNAGGDFDFCGGLCEDLALPLYRRD